MNSLINVFILIAYIWVGYYVFCSFSILKLIIWKPKIYNYREYTSQGQRFLNVIIDLVFIYILILSAGTTIVLIAEATNNFAVSSWVENMNFVEIIAYGCYYYFYYF
jgi:hypothetical protein